MTITEPFRITKHGQESYTFIRNGRPMIAVLNRDGDVVKVMRYVRGAATASTPQSAASQAAMVLRNYLQVAPERNYAIVGTIPAGLSGGSVSNVTWQQQIPIMPAFCDAIDYEFTLPVTLTLQPGASATLSNFAPYSAYQMQLTLGGAPPWPMSEMTPWKIDESMHRVDYDSAYPGLGNVSGWQSPGAGNGAFNPSGTVPILDMGTSPIAIGGAGSLSPGAVATNSGTAQTSTNYTWTFTIRQQMKRKRHLLWGAIPFGDPENRPNHLVQLNPLVGNNPEQNLFVNGTAGGVTCVTNGVVTVKVIYRLSYIDLLPPSMQQAPTPAVTYGLQLVVASPANLSVGAIYPMTHRTAMVYTAMHHLLINSQAPLRADYFGLWNDQDQQSSKWNYDAQNNTFNEYFTLYHRIYRRYPYTGCYTAELDDGEFPEIPSVTPLQALMTPDASYATAFNLPVTPAMTTALRIPSGTVLGSGSSAPYVRSYEYGLVRVPY
jgi:hypothetical protein